MIDKPRYGFRIEDGWAYCARCGYKIGNDCFMLMPFHYLCKCGNEFDYDPSDENQLEEYVMKLKEAREKTAIMEDPEVYEDCIKIAKAERRHPSKS